VLAATCVHTLQASLLLEADSFAARVKGGAESWAEEMEALLTEELDGRLRAHRPRAGRIEEEVRLCIGRLGWTVHACCGALLALSWPTLSWGQPQQQAGVCNKPDIGPCTPSK
jgi:hypothetical protein